MSKWYPIETAPRDDTEVITWDGQCVRIAVYGWEDRWHTPGMPSHKPTHWMLPPEPPVRPDTEAAEPRGPVRPASD